MRVTPLPDQVWKSFSRFFNIAASPIWFLLKLNPSSFATTSICGYTGIPSIPQSPWSAPSVGLRRRNHGLSRSSAVTPVRICLIHHTAAVKVSTSALNFQGAPSHGAWQHLSTNPERLGGNQPIKLRVQRPEAWWVSFKPHTKALAPWCSRNIRWPYLWRWCGFRSWQNECATFRRMLLVVSGNLIDHSWVATGWS